MPGLQIRLAGHMATIRRCIPQPRSEKRYGTSIGEQCGFTRTSQSYQDDIELRYVELIERICCDDVFLPIAMGDWMIYEFSS